jgi:hypothetical protein
MLQKRPTLKRGIKIKRAVIGGRSENRFCNFDMQTDGKKTTSIRLHFIPNTFQLTREKKAINFRNTEYGVLRLYHTQAVRISFVTRLN